VGPADRSDLPTDAAGLVSPPVLILSDLHLAHPATYFTDPSALSPLLDGMKTVVFNGDACELLSFKHRIEARRKLEAVADLCLSRGVRPLFLSGNHDPTVSSSHHLELFGGKVLVTHGDVLHPWLAPWARDAVHLKRERRRLLARRAAPADWMETLELCKEIGAVASRYDAKGKKGLLARLLMVGKFAVQPWRVFQALHYWSNVAHFAHELQERFFPAASLVVIGHTHRQGVWHLPTFTLVNTGSFQPLSKPLAVRLTSERAVVNRIELAGGVARFGVEIHHMHFANHSTDST
jgi:UDP-2,3-diacylglucosamine pyrophosphatase LpxH